MFGKLSEKNVQLKTFCDVKYRQAF